MFHYAVSSVRHAGDKEPAPLASGKGRLELVTAGGRSFMPSGLVHVDADLTDPAVGGLTPPFTAASLPSADRPMRGDSSTFWALVMWLQALLLVAVGTVWAFHRWGRPQAWIVSVPVLALVGLATAGELVRLLPNVL